MSSTEELAQQIPCFSSDPEHAENGCGKCTGCEAAARLRELEAELRKRDAIWLPEKDARIAELEAENRTLMRQLAADPDRAHSTGAAIALVEHHSEARIAALEAERDHARKESLKLANEHHRVLKERDDLQRRIDSHPDPDAKEHRKGFMDSELDELTYSSSCATWHETDGPGRDE